MTTPTALYDLTLCDLERSKSRSLRLLRLVFHKGAQLNMLLNLLLNVQLQNYISPGVILKAQIQGHSDFEVWFLSELS